MRIILILGGAFATVLTAVALGGCAADGGRGATAHGRVRVVAAFYPLAEAARRVGGSRVDVIDLTPRGAEPHELELDPKRVEAVLDAGVVVVMGKGFQPSVEEAAARTTGVRVEVLHALGVGGRDPHVWLDPVLMGRVVGLVRDALTRADPAGSDAYRVAAAAYQDELGGIDRRYRDRLAGCRRRVIVTAHEAFGWLAARYGLRQEAIAGISPDAEPDPRRLSQLAGEVRRQGTTTIFTETLVSPAVAETLAREAGVRTAVLNPIEGLSAADLRAGRTYVSLMDDNLSTLSAALDC